MSKGSCIDIAIIGLSSLFPSAKTTKEYWKNYENGVVSTERIPEGRWEQSKYWDGKKGEKYKIYCPNGGFIKDNKRFDHEYFGISSDEAKILDPQQKVSLELAKKLFDDAGYSKSDYYGKNISLFIGASQSSTTELLSFYTKVLQSDDKVKKILIEKFGEVPWHVNLTPDATPNLIAGRISHEFNLKGPSMIIDTACSSSLVALHYACHSLLAEEAEMAISGGVYLLNTAAAAMTFSAAGALSERGVLSAFDERADGFVPSEGAGLVLLKRLADAQKDGDHIYGVIKGSTVNNDGRTLGVMAPNPTEQRKVIQEFYERSEIKPDRIRYVEAHGTGTKIGDLSEFNSLSRVFNNWNMPMNSVFLGSGKSNVGHTIAASGIASLIRVIGMMQDNCVYKQANFELPNKKINFDKSPFKIATETIYFDEPDYLEYVALNSFGFGGTNAHLILENGSKYNKKNKANELTKCPIIIGAHTKAVLEQKRELLIEEINNNNVAANEFALWNNQINSEYEWKISGVVEDRESLLKVLQDAEATELTQLKSMLLFTGQGSQYLDMGKSVYDQIPAFRKGMDVCAALFEQESGIKLLELLYQNRDEAMLNSTQVIQSVVFAIDYTIGKLLLDAGLKPAYLVGHSVGEWVAATLADVVTLENAVKIICKRGELMSRADGKGKLVAVFSSLESIEEIINKCDVYVSSKNISHVVIGGTNKDVDRFVDLISKKNIRFSLLKVTSAFHTPLFNEVAEEFEKFLDNFTYETPKIPIIGNVTGETIPFYSAKYWSDHLIRPVLFEECISVACDRGVEAVIECGSKNILINMIKSAKQYSKIKRFINVLNMKDQSTETFSQSMVDISGISNIFNLDKVYEGIPHYKVLYPEYPFAGSDESLFVDFENNLTHKWLWSEVDVHQLEKVNPAIEINKSDISLTTKNYTLIDFIANLKEKLEKLKNQDQKEIDLVYYLPKFSCVSTERYDEIIKVLFQFSQEMLKVLQGYRTQLFNLIIVSNSQENELNYALHFSISNFVMSLASHMPNLCVCIAFGDWKNIEEYNGDYIQNSWIKFEKDICYTRSIVDCSIKKKVEVKPTYTNKNILIVGGFGSMGEELCDYFIRETNANVIVTGRNDNINEIEKKLERWKNNQDRILYYACDITKVDEFRNVVNQAESRVGKIQIVFNLAGRASQNIFCTIDNSYSDIKEILAPKILGTMVINEVFEDKKLDLLVLLSSVAVSDTKWSVGLADYSAANAFLNGMVQASNCRTIALNYTLIDADSGVDAKIVWKDKKEILKSSGLITMSRPKAIEMLLSVLEYADKSETIHIYEKYEQPPKQNVEVKTNLLIEEKTESPIELRKKTTPRISFDLQELESTLYRMISKFSQEEISDQNKYINFMDLGIDSMHAISLIEEVKTKLNIMLYPTIIFEYQTPYELYQYIMEQHSDMEQDNDIQLENRAVPEEDDRDDRVAIVGFDLKTAGSQSKDEFWDNLIKGKCSIGEIPEDHFISKVKEDKLIGGYIKNVYEFDPMFYGISPVEAKYMDPQQRKFLESCYVSLQSAGCLGEFTDKNIGVYIGVEQNNYNEQFSNARFVKKVSEVIGQTEEVDSVEELLSASQIGPDSVAGNSLNEVACRVSYTFGLTGPSLVLNTACSSSLVALSVATSDLMTNKINAAVVGGVNLNLSDLPFAGLNQVNALSKTNSSRPFDNHADGMVLGEAVVSLVLKKVAKAKADGNYIYGIVENVATNNNGFAQGITVPSVTGQREVILKAIGENERIFEKLRYIEAHGTATPLGDPIEVASIVSALEGKLKETCYIGSNKGNFGHSLSASGLLSVAKCLEIFKHDTIPPIANFSTINVSIPSLADKMLALADREVKLTDEDYYLGVNAFGFGGTNAHVILKKYHNVKQNMIQFPQIVTLSHYSMEMIQQTAKVLERIVSIENMGAILKKLNCHSKIFPYKVAFTITSLEDFQLKLQQIRRGEMGSDIYHKRVNGKISNVSIYSTKENQITKNVLNEVLKVFGNDQIENSESCEKLLIEFLTKTSSTKFQLTRNLEKNNEEIRINLNEYKIFSLKEVFDLFAELFSKGVVFDFRKLYRHICMQDENILMSDNKKSYRAREFKQNPEQIKQKDCIFMEIDYKNELSNKQKNNLMSSFVK